MVGYMSSITTIELDAIKNAVASNSKEKLDNIVYEIVSRRYEEGVKVGKTAIKDRLINGLGDMFANL